MKPYIGCYFEFYTQPRRHLINPESLKSRFRNTRIRFKKRARHRLKNELRKLIEE